MHGFNADLAGSEVIELFEKKKKQLEAEEDEAARLRRVEIRKLRYEGFVLWLVRSARPVSLAKIVAEPYTAPRGDWQRGLQALSSQS